MELKVQVEDYEKIPEELGSGVPKTPHVAVVDNSGKVVDKGYTDEDGYIDFSGLEEGNYRVIASSLSEDGYKDIELEEDTEVILETDTRETLKQLGDRFL